ncbi:MAG: hypothetical protein DRO99_04015, partial [Candidatus Aenigmatarchaeota archaeon]
QIEIADGLRCVWSSGFCDPKGFGGQMGGGPSGGMGMNCMQYDGNQTACNNQSGCSFMEEAEDMQFCDIDFSSNCPQYSYNQTICNQQPRCKWNQRDGFCDEKPFECNWNETLKSDQNLCDSHPYCYWNDGNCDIACFSSDVTTSSACNAVGGGNACRWISGWCEPTMGAQMFQEMEKGAPMMMGTDPCGEEGIDDEVDICGFGMKDSGEAWIFGIGTNSMSNAVACKDVLIGPGTVGQGTNTTRYFWYLDTDGSDTGGCAAKDDPSLTGFEFYLKYESSLDQSTGSASNTYTAYKCVGGSWGVADIKLSSKQEFMCKEIMGGMIAVSKGDLNKYPSLFIPGNDFRVYVASASASGSITNPTDVAGPGYGTPNAIDFKMECCWDPGADCDEDGIKSQNDPDCESILEKGYVEYEDCLNGVDDDNNGLTDCSDPACKCENDDCSDMPKCANTGVNADTYVDTTAPVLKAVQVEEYQDAALVMYFTDEPANGTLTFYHTSSTCSESVPGKFVVNDSGITYDTVRKYKLWHDAYIDEEAKQGPMVQNTTYYYKLKVCDKAGNCGTSACTALKTIESSDKCYFCDFVTKIVAPTGWTISYDTNRDGVYEHVQGQVCGPNAGMKTNYSMGKDVNILLSKDDNSTWIRFIGARLTRSALSWKTRDFKDEGLTAGSSGSVGYTGMPAATRDKIVNSLHPKECQVKIPGTSDELWHCDDGMSNCYEIENAAELYLNESGDDYRVWNIPYCEFSVWAGGDLSDSGSNPPGGGSPGGGTPSGGGGAVTGVKETVNLGTILGGSTISAQFTNQQLAVTQVTLTAKNTVNYVAVKAEQSSDRPEEANVNPSGSVYGYITMSVLNMRNENMTKAQINFRVNKSWISSQGVSEDDIVLQRFIGGGWESLDTERTSSPFSLIGAITGMATSANDYAYYVATTPGFSVFAITTKADAAVSGDDTGTDGTGQADQGTGTGDRQIGEQAGDEQGTDETPQDYTQVIIIIAVIIIAAVAGFFIYRSKA